MTDEWDKLTKKELIQLLKPYDDNALITIGVNLQQGYVGFYDVEHDNSVTDTFKFVLKSNALDRWYEDDITELKQQNKLLSNENEQLKKNCLKVKRNTLLKLIQITQ